MSVHRVLATGVDEGQVEAFHCGVCGVANLIERRGMTCFYTVFDEDLPLLLRAAMCLQVTVQVRAESGIDWPVRFQGLASPWRPRPDV